MTVEGLEHTIEAIKSSRLGIPTAIYVTMSAGMQEILSDVKTEPPQRPPANPQSVYIRGVGTRYTRKDGSTKTYKTSEKYAATSTYRVLREDDNVVGYVNSKASYAVHLRGSLLQPDLQAWMHQNRWKTLASIVEDRIPVIQLRMERAVEEVMKKNGL